MLKVIRGSEIGANHELMDRLFRLRYENFVLRRNWALACKDERDIDQYDNSGATYFILLTNDARHIVASSRINATDDGSLLADLFPHLVEGGPAQRSPAVFEGTRFIIQPSLLTAQQRRAARARLCGAICRWAIEEGGTHLQAVVEMSAFPSFLEMSLGTRALGLPHDYGGGPKVRGGGRCIAFQWALTPNLLSDFEAYGQAPESQTFEADTPVYH